MSLKIVTPTTNGKKDNTPATAVNAKEVSTVIETKTTDTTPPVIVPEVKEEVKPDTAKKLPSIEARLKKLADITELAERRDTVTEALQNLHGFYISPEGGSCNLRLTDSKNKTFAIAHPFVIGEMVCNG